jgi:hypothetical protein
VEIETYRSKYLSRLPFREFSVGATSVPITAEYEMRPVPTSLQEAAESDMPLDARRAADIHVKVPGDFRAYEYGTSGSERVRAADRAVRSVGHKSGKRW